MSRRAAALGAAAGLALAFGVLPSAAAGAAQAHVGSFGGDLTGVSCVSAADCWAVGGTGNNVPVTDHWDGTAWSQVHVPAPPGSYTAKLPAISCTGVASCWAVGDYGATATSQQLPYAERWNGTAWSAIKLPHPAGAFDSALVSVACANTVSCWAVGTAGSPAAPLLEHWNGSAWSIVSAAALGAGADPAAVYCATASDCWLTGQDAQNGTLAAHWTGHAWSVTPAPTSGSGAGELLGIGCGGRDCMSVGDTGGDHPGDTLAERWNGSAWAVTPTGQGNAIIAGVSCTAGFWCLATGNTLAGRVFSEVWNGTAWRIVPPDWPPGSQASGLVGVACLTATDCWSVGSRFSSGRMDSLIEHWNGTTWSVAA